MKFYYIYKITNLINNKIYIGKRTCNISPELDSDYLGSGKLIAKAIKKYGKNNFKKEILEICTPETINEKEKFHINQQNSTCPKIGYNLTEGGDGVGQLCSKMKTYYNNDLNKEIRIMNTEIAPEGFTPGRRPFLQETKNKMARKGKLNGMYGVHRFGNKNPFFGKTHTEETKQLLSNIQKDACWMINQKTQERIRVLANEQIPDGFVPVNQYNEEKHKIARQDKMLKFKEMIEEKTDEKIETVEEKEILKKVWSIKRKNFWETQPVETCPYCGKQGRGVGFYRWHMNNCINHPENQKENREKQEKWKKKQSEDLKLRTNKLTTKGKIGITNGIQNKFIFKEDLSKYPGFRIGITKIR